jgi:hypothetical protein
MRKQIIFYILEIIVKKSSSFSLLYRRINWSLRDKTLHLLEMLLKSNYEGGGRKIHSVMLKKVNTQRKTMSFKDIMFNFDIRPQET